MAKPLFVWLGSGRTKRRRVAGPAHWLDETTRAGLPVPAGAVLLDEFFRFCQDNDLVEQCGTRITVADPELLHNTLFHSIHLPEFDGPITLGATLLGSVAPSASSIAIDSKDPVTLAGELARVWSALTVSPSPVRYDVYLLEVVPATVSGFATSKPDETADLVWVERERQEEGAVSLARLGRWERPREDTPPFMGRLQQLLRGLRRTLPRQGWRVDWADDGDICWVTGICTLAEPGEPAQSSSGATPGAG